MPQQRLFFSFRMPISFSAIGYLVLFLSCLCFSVRIGNAATLTVNSTADNQTSGDGRVTLREAINAANDYMTTDLGETGSGDDLIVFDPSVFSPNTTIVLKLGEIRITSNLIIRGEGKVILDGNMGEIFHVSNNAYVQFRNFTMQNGLARGYDGETKGTGGGGGAGMGGALFINSGHVECARVNFFSHNAEGGNGGGVQMIVDGGAGGASSHNLSSGGAGGRSGPTGTGGGNGGFGAGGGGGVGEWFLHHKADRGGNGGFGGGGGGGGGGAWSSAVGGKGGQFGGNGGDGIVAASNANGGGGGGAGLGGAIFVNTIASLTLDSCAFHNCKVSGGSGGPRAQHGQGKGNAIFIMDGATVSMYGTTFEHGADTDVHGNYTTLKPTPDTQENVVVTTNLDENDYVITGDGMSLREAIRNVLPGGTITFSESFLPGVINIHPYYGSLAIKKDLTIAGPGKEKLTINGLNRKRVFFVGDADVQISGLTVKDSYGKGGNGGGISGGGAAGMGGGLFLNRGSLRLQNMDFIHCIARGGNGADGHSTVIGGGGGFGGDAVGAIGGSGGELGGKGGNTGYGIHGGDGAGGGGTSWKNGGNGGFGGGGGCGSGAISGNGGFGAGGAGRHDIVSFGAPELSRIGQEGISGQFAAPPKWGNGGGGAGLGGAIFVRNQSLLIMENCHFENNQTIGGITPWGYNPIVAARKGGAIFAMSDSCVYGRNLSFTGNICSNSPHPSGIEFGKFNDTHDVYGHISPITPWVVSVSREMPKFVDITQQTNLNYIVTFSGHVEGVDISDFELVKNDPSLELTLQSLESISPSKYRLHIHYLGGFGKFTLRFNDDDSVYSPDTGKTLQASEGNPDGSLTSDDYYLILAPKTLPIQAVLPLQGKYAKYGQAAKEGFDLAISDFNRPDTFYKITLEMKYQDSLSTEKGAQEAVSKALSDTESIGILSALSANTIAIASLVVEQNKTLFSPATTIQLRNYSKNLVKTSPLDDYQAAAMVHYLQDNEISKIVLLVENSNYGKSIASLLQETNAVDVVQSYHYTTGQLQNDTAVLQEAIETFSSVEDVEHGIIAGYADDANAFLNAVQENSVLRYFKWIVSDGCVFNETFQGLPSIYLEGYITGFTPATVGYQTEEHSDDFQYEKTYGKKPTWDVYYNYDTAMTLIHAIKKAFPSLEPTNIWNAVPGLKFTGVTGPREYDNEGELISAVYSIYKVRDGQWTVVGQDRIDQPPPGVDRNSIPLLPVFSGGEFPPESYGFKQWLPGSDPGIHHFAGHPGDDKNWIAQSAPLDEGWTLIAYYEDTRRDVNNDGKSFIFVDGQSYNLSFDMNRRNLDGAISEGTILNLQLTAVTRYVNEYGQESFATNMLPSHTITFADWPNDELTRITIPFIYKAAPAPETSTSSLDDYLLKWELRLHNTARQEIELRKVWTWAEPLDEDLPPFESPVMDWLLY